MAHEQGVYFTMHGARDAVATGLSHIEQHVDGIERAVTEDPGLVFDLAKTVVESTCRTILAERAVTFSPSDDLPQLFRAVSRNLPFLPIELSTNAEIRGSLVQTISGLHTAIQGICELRNQCGSVSHGSAGPRPTLESAQALLAAEAADAIIGFLYRVHQQDRLPRPSGRALYDENVDFNAVIDEVHDIIRIYEVEFRPSDVLFQMEPETYRIYLGEFATEREETVLAAEQAT
jgi:hypothetical protein